jgi:hypothetical protein
VAKRANNKGVDSEGGNGTVDVMDLNKELFQAAVNLKEANQLPVALPRATSAMRLSGFFRRLMTRSS